MSKETLQTFVLIFPYCTENDDEYVDASGS